MQDDEPISPDLMKTIVEVGVLNEIPAIRKISLTFLMRILLFIKNRSTNSGESKLLGIKEKVAVGGDKKKWFDLLMYDPSAIKSSETRYIDDLRIGWYCLPHTIVVYKNGPDVVSPAYPDSSSDEAIKYLSDLLKTDSFWTKFLAFAAQESNNKDVEQISLTLIKLYKSMFQLFQDDFLYGLLLPKIVELSGKIAEKSSQRASAELVFIL